MREETVSALAASLLLAVLLMSAFEVQPARASGTVYIRADGSVDPITVPISRLDNFTYVFTDDIYDHIIVERGNIVIDGNGHTLQSSSGDSGFYWGNINNVTVKNTIIRGFRYGVYLNSTSHNVLSGNFVTNNSAGIYLELSSNNTLFGNSLAENNWYGLFLYSSSNNSMYGNTMTNNWAGIAFERSSNNSIYGNSIANNWPGILLSGSSDNNTIHENEIINNDGDGILLSNSSNNRMFGNTILSNDYGITVESSLNNQMYGNNIANNLYGIGLYNSSNNNISENMFVNDGLFVADSFGNVVSENFINGLPLVYLEGVSNFTVNDAGQVILINCNNMLVMNLDLSNAAVGLELWKTNNSIVTTNNITLNNVCGIVVYRSSGNKLYHNNFINAFQISNYESINTWDDGYPSGGNYWADSIGVDLCRGPFQNITGSDGVGDTPYTIDVDNHDNYLLVKPYAGIHDIGVTSVTTPKTVVGVGYNTDITVKIINYGVNSENSIAKVYANSTIVASNIDIIVSGRDSTFITCSWNTAGLSKGNYILGAYAEPVADEEDTTDNNCTGGIVKVTIPGDVTTDELIWVDMQDISIMIDNFMATPPSWNPNCDVNNDFSIDMADISIAIDHFMQA